MPAASPFLLPAPAARLHLGTLPPVSTLGRQTPTVESRPHPLGEAGTMASLRAVRDAVLRGYVHPEVRAWAIKQLKQRGNPTDQAGRAKALLEGVRETKIWVPDPPNTEYVQEAHLTLGEGPDRLTFDGGDCFAEGTLLLTDAMRLVPVEQIRTGDRIWGLDRWVRVEATADKGTLTMAHVHLSNGGVLRLTGGHHVNVLLCPKHPDDGSHNNPCSCPITERVATRMRVVDLRPGMALPQPAKIHLEAMGVHSPWAASRLKGLPNPLPRVRHVEFVGVVPCHDIQTEDHNVYLPEHDVTVLNCDDLAIATLSAYLSLAGSVGCYAAVVGHSYSPDRQLSHVLGAILDPETNKWLYVEPSSQKVPFGESYKPTREVVFIVPGNESERPDCDAGACLVGSRQVQPPQQRPQFFGVSGLGAAPDETPPTGIVPRRAAPPAGRPSVAIATLGSVLGADDSATNIPDAGDLKVSPVPSPIGEGDKIGAWLLGLRDDLAASITSLRANFDALSEVADASGDPLPNPDRPDVFGQGQGASTWTADDTLYTRTLSLASEQLLRMMDRVLAQYQPLVWAKETKNFGLVYDESDPWEIAIKDSKVVLTPRGKGPGGFMGNPAAAAAAPVAAAAGGVTFVQVMIVLAILGGVLITTVYFVAKYNEYKAQQAKEETERRLADLFGKCLDSPNCSEEQRRLIGRAFGVHAGAIEPVPQPGAYGTGEGYGWAWLAWPLIIGMGIATLFSLEKVYTRQSNRARRFSQRAERARKEEREKKRQAGGKATIAYGRPIGWRPDGTPIIDVGDEPEEPGILSRVVGSLFG